jgi:predicted secreted hydrolase
VASAVRTVYADTTAPSVSITGPTTSSVTPLPISGTASDNLGVVTQVTWVNDRGGSGIASGTTSWSVPSIALQSGANLITVTARDAAGNQGSATLTVTYDPPVSSTSSDTIAPTIEILGPTTSPSYTTSSSAVTLGGTASDNIEVISVIWANNRGGTGIVYGSTTKWSVPSVQLKGGANVITVTAQDEAGNKSTATLTVTKRGGSR